MEPAEALDTELAGQFAAIGIVKGEKFAPDARLRKILDEAVAVGNAASRTLGMGAHPTDDFRLYDGDSAWWNMLWVGGFEFTNPPPMITADGIRPFPDKGARQLHGRTSFFYTATGVTPAMCMRLTNVGSQYLVANVDADGEPLDGAKTYRLTLPKDIPAARFWSLNVYDNQTRSMLQTDQRYPRAGSQSTPRPPRSPSRTDPPSSTSHPHSRTASRRATGSRPTRPGLVHHPAPLQPAPALLRQDLAARRVRTRRLTSKLRLASVTHSRSGVCRCATKPQNRTDRKEAPMTESASETPVLDLLARMTADSLDASSLDPDILMVARVAALVAVDAPPISYLLNLAVAGEVGIDAETVRGVLAAVAPIVGTARVASATGKIAEALEVAIEVAELDETRTTARLTPCRVGTSDGRRHTDAGDDHHG